MKSIRTKLWLGMMILVGVVIMLLWLFQIVFLEKFYSSLEIRAIMKNAKGVITEIEKLDGVYQVGDSSDVIEVLDNFIYSKQLSVQISDVSGNILYQSASSNNMAMPGMLKETVSEVVSNALQGIETKKEVDHPKFGNKFMIIAAPIYLEDMVQGAMIITVPMASVEDTAAILKKQLILITAILLLVSVMISFRLSKVFTKPILDISKLAENYSLGKFDTRIHSVSSDEIGHLAQRMNHMGEELTRNEILQKELIANVSHELRTPLTLIRGYAETLRDVTGAFPEKREKQLGVIIEESERLSNIVEDILSLSQLQAGVGTIEIESFSLKNMLVGIRERYELQEETRTFKISGVTELTNNLLGDKRRVEQVFYNLINNAFHHTKEDDIVEIRVTQSKDRVKIEVKDTGEGIEEEDLKHIFERYYKGKRLDGNKTTGTGLGLAIVKSILDMHRVSFGVESKVGQGTTFWFELKKDNSHTSF